MSYSTDCTKEAGEEPQRVLSPVLHWYKFFIFITPEQEEDLKKDTQTEGCLLNVQ